MTKTVRLSFFLVLIAGPLLLYSQPNIGVFAGLNFGRLSGDAPVKGKYKALPGANVGAFIDLKLSNSILLSLQPSYSQEGTKISYTLPQYEKPIDSITIQLNYFSLPLLLKVTSTNERFYALGGIEAGLLVDSFVSSHDIKEDIKADVAQWNIAMQFGAGIRIPVGFPKLLVELRYSQGLVNLTDEPIEESYVPRVKTTGFKFLVGVEIPLKKQNN
jgi:hypothetical protein